MEEVRECSWCEEPFVATRMDKVCCSKRCSTSYSGWRKKTNKPRLRQLVKDEGEFRKCNCCGKWKLREEEFSKCGKFRLGKCNACKREEYKLKKRTDNKDVLFNDVEKFVYKMKAKHYYCDGVDVWRLIDVYDRIFPTQQNLPYLSNYNMDMEKSVITMFYKIARWYADERDKRL